MNARYYQDELRYLREMGREFAEQHPEFAPLLLEAGVDPSTTMVTAEDFPLYFWENPRICSASRPARLGEGGDNAESIHLVSSTIAAQ